MGLTPRKYPEDFINKIICGDCLEVMKKMPDKCIDMVLTSPPYDNLRDYDGYAWDFKKIARELLRILKDGAVVVWIIGDATINGSETGTSFRQVLFFKEIGFNLHDTMIYEKSGFSKPSHNRYHQTFEYMFILSKGQPEIFNPLKDRKNLWDSWGKNTKRQQDGSLKEHEKRPPKNDYGKRFNVWRYAVGYNYSTGDMAAYDHPAIFPDKLALDHIISWSNEDNVILDPFLGSGTTIKACRLLHRNFIGIEINPDYCKIAEERLAQGVL